LPPKQRVVGSVRERLHLRRQQRQRQAAVRGRDAPCVECLRVDVDERRVGQRLRGGMEVLEDGEVDR